MDIFERIKILKGIKVKVENAPHVTALKTLAADAERNCSSADREKLLNPRPRDYLAAKFEDHRAAVLEMILKALGTLEAIAHGAGASRPGDAAAPMDEDSGENDVPTGGNSQASGSGFTADVPRSRTKRSKADVYDEVADENSRLREENELLVKANEDLEAKNLQTLADLDAVNLAKARIQAQIDALRHQMSEMQAGMQRDAPEMARLRAQLDEKVRQQAALQIKYDCLCQTNRVLHKKFQESSKIIKMLTSKNNELQREVEAAAKPHMMGGFDEALSQAFMAFSLAEMDRDASLAEDMTPEEFNEILHARFRQSRQSTAQ